MQVHEISPSLSIFSWANDTVYKTRVGMLRGMSHAWVCTASNVKRLEIPHVEREEREDKRKGISTLKRRVP